MEESTKYRFKTEEEFKRDGEWNSIFGVPERWNHGRKMNKYIGEDIPNKYNQEIESGHNFHYGRWSFESKQCVIKEEKLSVKELYNNILVTINTVSNK
jgi:hypothetical protein